MKFLSIVALSWLLLATFPQPAYADEVVRCKPSGNGNVTCLMRKANGELYVRTYYAREP